MAKNRQKYPQIDIQINRFSIKLCVHTPKSMSHYIFDDELSNYLIKTMQKYIPDYYIYLTYHIISQAVKNNKGVSETKTYLSKLGLKYDGDIHKLMSDPNSLQPNLCLMINLFIRMMKKMNNHESNHKSVVVFV